MAKAYDPRTRGEYVNSIVLTEAEQAGGLTLLPMKSLGRNRVAFFVSTVVSDDGSGTKEAGFLAFFEESQLNGLEEAIREYRVKYLS